MTRTLDFRADNEDRFYDIDFRQMQSEPIETVRSLYAWLGAEVSVEFEAGMRRWWQTAAANREQIDRPGPEAFGIDVDGLESLSPATPNASSPANRR